MDAVLACSSGHIFRWAGSAWQTGDAGALLKSIQLPIHAITDFTQELADLCGVNVNHFALFPEHTPVTHQPGTALPMSYSQVPNDSGNWTNALDLTTGTGHSQYGFASLRIGCHHDPDLELDGTLAVGVWLWPAHDGSDHAKLNTSQATVASFGKDNRHRFRTSDRFALLIGDDARAFLEQVKQRDYVEFLIPLADGLLSVTFNLYEGTIDPSTEAMLRCRPLAIDFGNIEPDPPQGGSRSINGSHGGTHVEEVTPRLRVSCLWEDWHVSISVSGYKLQRGGGTVRVEAILPKPWIVDLTGRHYTFRWNEQHRWAELHDREARDFWLAAERAGVVEFRMRSGVTYTFDLGGPSSAEWDCN